MKPRLVWWLFWAGTIATLLIVGILSVKLVAFEERHRADLAEREHQRRLNLALFRMEAQLAPILAAENTRPYFHYRAEFPSREPYRVYLPGVAVQADEEMQNSPLAGEPPAFVKHHFELGPERQLFCVTRAGSPGAKQAPLVLGNRATLMACTPPAASNADADPAWGTTLTAASETPAVAREWQIRSLSRMQQAIAQKTGSVVKDQAVRIAEGVMVPVWIDDEMVFVRQLDVAGKV